MNARDCAVTFCGFTATSANGLAVHASMCHNLQRQNPLHLDEALCERIRPPSSAFIRSSSQGLSAKKRHCYRLSSLIAPRAREDCGSRLDKTEESAVLVQLRTSESYNPSIKGGEVQQECIIRVSSSPSLEPQMNNEAHLLLPTQSKEIELVK